MEFHIDYIESEYSLTADELRCLSKALGYPISALKTIFNLQLKGSIEVKNMIALMEQPHFNIRMNQIFNIYTSSWNQHLIMTSILLLGHKAISFKELNLMRCVYHFFEEDDGKGLVIGINQLLHHLKMCGKIIAPMKMIHRLKHMKHRLYQQNRLQLWEFLELNIWSDVQAFIDEYMKPLTKCTYDNIRSKNHISDLEKDLSIIYGDINAWENENVRYIKEEWTLPKGNFRKILRLIYKPLKMRSDLELKRQLVQNCNYLKKKVVLSNNDVSIAHATCFKFNNRQSGKSISETPKNNDRLELSHKNMLQNLPVEKLSKRPKTAPIVTEKDIENNKLMIEECKKYILKLPEKYKERIQLDMEYLKPGFWTRWENRPPTHYSQLTSVNLDLRRKPSKRHIEKLSKSASRSSVTFHNSCIELK